MSADEPVGLAGLLIPALRKIDAVTVRKGFRMFDNGAVKQESYDEDRDAYSMFVVSESNPRNGYMVDIGVEDVELEVHCTCKYFEGHVDCKHIAASMIKLINDFVGPDEINHLGVRREKRYASAGKTFPQRMADSAIVPTQVFQHIYRMSGFRLTTAKSVQATSLITENLNDPAWQFQYNESKTVIYYPELKYDRKESFAFKCNCHLPEKSACT